MENNLRKVIFKLEGFNIDSTNIINNHILLLNEKNQIDFIKYKIINYLGKGTVGQVYLLEPINLVTNKKYVIKISNSDRQNDLINEVDSVDYYFNKYQITHNSYPLYWGHFNNLNAVGVIYPYLGFYNLEKIKKINYNINWENNILIIKQLINQLINLKNLIHGDLKSANLVIDVIDNKIEATIIDFGLIKKKSSRTNIISTNYITSPESLLSLERYFKCVDPDDSIDFSKHDYYGMFTIIMDLFLKNNFWNIFSSYLTEKIKLNSSHIVKHEAIDIFGYAYFRFFYDNSNELSNNSLKNLIYKIEINYPNISTKQFYNFEKFFKSYIEPNLDFIKFNSKYINEFKDFLIKIYHFDPVKRSELNELLTHPFLNRV
jgi:serine/threonine protein kinase